MGLPVCLSCQAKDCCRHSEGCECSQSKSGVLDVIVVGLDGLID